MELKIVELEPSDRDFVVFANQEIDKASFIKSSKLAENIDKDVVNSKKAVCLMAKDGNKNVGMMLFSKVYWADRGEGIYISQAYVLPKYRRFGVFRNLLKSSFEYYTETQFVTCLVARKNTRMVECMRNLTFEDENMISYVKNKADFYKSITK